MFAESWQIIGILTSSSQGQRATDLPRQLKFTKDIEPGTDDKADHLIETNVYATYADSREFGQHIRKNDLVDWDCEIITYPVTDSILSTLSHLGTISGILPHEKMFPLGTEMDESEFELQLTLVAYNNLLKAQFAVKLPSGILCPLKDVRYIPLPLAPRSELLNRGAPSDQIPVNGTARDEPRSSHEQQSLTLSGSSLWVSPGSCGSSALARNEHAARGTSTSSASHSNSTTSERTIMPIFRPQESSPMPRLQRASSGSRLQQASSGLGLRRALSGLRPRQASSGLRPQQVPPMWRLRQAQALPTSKSTTPQRKINNDLLNRQLEPGYRRLAHQQATVSQVS